MKGIKFDDFKDDWTLLPFQPIVEVIKVLMCGACKYFRDNWQKVERVRYEKALMRAVPRISTTPERSLPAMGNVTCASGFGQSGCIIAAGTGVFVAIRSGVP